MSTPLNLCPRLSLLGEDDLRKVHAASLKILEQVGVRVECPRARQALAGTGARVMNEDRCGLSAEMVQAALASAPRYVPVFDRLGSPAFTVGAGETRFGIGVTNLYYEDPSTGEIVPFCREHMRAAVRLGQALPEYDLVSTVGIVQDEPVERADLVATLVMVANTTKPLVLLVSDPEQFSPALDLLEAATGSAEHRPFVLPYVNPITPLVLNKDTTDKMAATIERGLPVIFSNYGMAGASTPMSPFGALVTLNAELLAGLILGQALRPAAQMVLGSLPAYFDMRTMVDFYDPRSMLVDLACAEMMAWYGLPHVGASGSGSGWGPDVIAAGGLWFNHLVSCLGSAGLAPFVGGNFGSKVFSPALAVLGAEIITQVRVFAGGLTREDEAGLTEEIAVAGPGGNFLGSPETLRRLRSGYHVGPVFPHYSLEKWQELGQPSAEKRLRELTAQLIASARPPEDHEAVLSRGLAWLDAHLTRSG